MSDPGKWWWGLVPVAVIWGGSNWLQDRGVETDLHSRAAAIATTGLYDGGVTISGRDATVTGLRFSPDESAAVVAGIAKEWGVRKVIDATTAPPEAKPFDWSLTRAADGGVTLSGHVGDPATRVKIVDAAKAAFAGVAVTDAMSFAAGAPAGFETGALFGIGQLSQLAGGALSLKDGALSISGAAPDKATFDAVNGALAKLPDGLTLAGADIAPPPVYSFTASRTGDRVTLDGSVPGEDVRARIAGAVKEQFFDATLDDRLKVDANAPAGFADAILAGIGALSRLGDGAFTLENTDLKLGGAAFYDKAASAIRERLAGLLPAGFKAETDEIRTAAPAAAVDSATCQADLNNLLKKTTILFDTGAASIAGTSFGVLDRIVAIVARCPSSAIEIGGHTDSVGNDEANMALSEKRSQAVASYLTGAGADPANFTATGYGASKPVADNGTEEGRALNRRIEFIVK